MIGGILRRVKSRFSVVNDARVQELERKTERLEAIVKVFVQQQEYSPASDAGLNGQVIRKELIRDICHRFSPDCVIETGTFFGLSTGYFASQLNVPVYTSEIDPTYFQVAKYLLRNVDGVHQFLMDSRKFLMKMTSDENLRICKPLIYLDAHWHDDLPLREELQIAFAGFNNLCVIVDDFQVPWDSGYQFDDYGRNGALKLEFIRDIVEELDLEIFFPKVSARKETGSKRGCAVIVRKNLAPVLSNVDGLAQLERH